MIKINKFRPESDCTTPIDENKLGVGSIIRLGINGAWLVVGTPSHSKVYLVSLTDFKGLGSAITVVDVNWLTMEEARSLCNLTNTNATFTDFDIDSAGIKGLND